MLLIVSGENVYSDNGSAPLEVPKSVLFGHLEGFEKVMFGKDCTTLLKKVLALPSV